VLPLESVPNVSEGRDAATIDALATAFSSGGARLLDVHSDPDHHRSVFTLVGDDAALVDSLVAGVAAARELIDLRRHDGVHPRVGAADVVPIVPLRRDDLGRAKAAAVTVAERIAGELGLPVFLYAESGDGRRPAFFRRGGPGELQRRVDMEELAPDFGPPRLDPAAGAVLVGARAPLVAFNVELSTGDVEVARAVAAVVRESSGGLPGVQALGLLLERTGRAQVSMNIVDVEATPLHEAVALVRSEAAARGVDVARGELVGLLPGTAVAAAAAPALALDRLDPDRVLELRLLDVDGEP
jgi:glutamate formiminotransferase / 5-formyltetrahydrofolate cyclo-ligase